MVMVWERDTFFVFSKAKARERERERLGERGEKGEEKCEAVIQLLYVWSVES
jgi:hypothetical protein